MYYKRKILFALLVLVFAIWCLWGVFIIVEMAYDFLYGALRDGDEFPTELVCWVGVFPFYAVCIQGAISYSRRQKRSKPRQ